MEKIYTYTNKDLIELCRQLGIKKYSGLNKQALVNLILSNTQSPKKPPDPSFFASIPVELRKSILLTLPYDQILELCSKDINFSSSCTDDDTWKKLFERDFGSFKSISNKTAKNQYEEALARLNNEEWKEDQVILSAKNGWIRVIEEIGIKRKDVIDSEKNDALIAAAENGHLEIVKYLLSKKANIHAKNNYALRLAAQNGHLEVVKYLVSQKADIHAFDDEALRWAAQFGHLGVVEYLVSQEADIHAFYDLALISAAENGHLEIVKFLVLKGANIRERGNRALREAEKNGHPKVVKYLQSII